MRGTGDKGGTPATISTDNGTANSEALPVSSSPHPLISSSPLTLSDRERELLRPEVAALAAGVGDPTLRAAYGTLLEGVEQATVPPESQERLEGLLEMGLQTGRFRRQHGAIDAQLLYRLYGRTPRGKAMAEELSGVNKALAELDGQTVDGLALSAKGPGEYELTVETDTCRMAITIGAGGVHLSSLEMGI